MVGRNSPERCAFIYADAPLREFVWVCVRGGVCGIHGSGVDGEGDMWGT